MDYKIYSLPLVFILCASLEKPQMARGKKKNLPAKLNGNNIIYILN